MHSTLDWESYNGSSSTTLTEVAKNKARTFSVDSIMALQLEAEVLEFPGHATTTYLNEGAANIVYSIKVPHAFHTPGRHCQCGDEKTTCINEPWHGTSFTCSCLYPSRGAHTSFGCRVYLCDSQS